MKKDHDDDDDNELYIYIYIYISTHLQATIDHSKLSTFAEVYCREEEE